MPDRRQVLRALLLGGAGLALPAGCGVPSGGSAIVDGPGPPYDPVGGQQGKPPDPADADSPTKLVELFLAAVAGPIDTSDLRAAAKDRARKFLTADAAKSWQPLDQVTVVRVDQVSTATSGRDATTVVAMLQPVGVMTPQHGDVVHDANLPSASVRVEFTVVPNPDRSGFLINSGPDALPPGLMLSTAALDEQYFTPQVIYFWDNNKHDLIPDLRYVPRAGVPVSQQRAYIVRWLIGGPSELISSVATEVIPEDTNLSLPNVLTESNRLVVNLVGVLQGVDLAKVMSQLRWSLQPGYPLSAPPIQLEIASRPQQVDGSAAPYEADNPADSESRDLDPQPFCVVGGQVNPVDGGYAVPPVLAGVNRYVLRAAVSRDRLQAALVCSDLRMWLGVATKAGGVSYTDSGLGGGKWSRPQYLPSGKRVLVAVDGTLRAVTGPGAYSTVMASVTAFSVSPDGYRIAFVSGGELSVGGLRDAGERLSVTNPRPLDPGLKEVTGVAWTRMDRLIVSGLRSDGLYGLAEISIDGAILIPWTGSTFKSRIASVVAYPKLPSQLPGSGPVLVQTVGASGNLDAGEAFRVFASSQAKPLDTQAPSPQPSPSPSGVPVTKPPPTAPFYVD
jgi:lipoprotein LpqB-like beta-propeller protein